MFKNFMSFSMALIKLFTTNLKIIFVYFIIALLSVLLLWNSGYLGQQLVDSRTKQLILVATISIIFFAYILFVDYKSIILALKSKRWQSLISSEVVLFLVIFFTLLLSFIFNNKKAENLNSYLMIMSIIVCSYFVLRLFSFRQFAKVFVGVSLTISIISVIIYIFYMISGRDLAMTIIQKSDNRFVTSFLGFFFRNQTNYNNRLQGPFWEPGVFATFSLISILLYHYFFNQKKYIIPAFFSFTILLTESTAGYLILIPIWLLIILNRFSKERRSLIFSLFIVMAALAYLFYPYIITLLSSLLPNVFGKIAEMDVSFLTRLTSISYGFEVFKTSPIFGVGGVTARNLYFEFANADGVSIDAFTSTFGFLMAAYGIVGVLIFFFPIIGILVCKNIYLEGKVLLVIIYFLLTQKESHAELMAIQIVYYYIFFYSLSNKNWLKYSPNLYNLVDTKTTILNLLFSKDEKGNVASNLTINTIVKILSLIVGFVTIPVYYKYFGDNQLFYGLWLTLISTSTWILTFDFGFGNSLRNKLSEAIINKQRDTSQKLISTTYLLTTLLSVIWIILSAILVFTVDLNSFFKISQSVVSPQTLRFTVFIILSTIALELVLKNIIYILQVLGKSGIASALSLISNVSLLTVLTLVSIDNNYIYQFISITYMASLLLPLIVATIYIFNIKKSVPSINFRNVDKKSFNAIAKLGIGFFVVQLSNLFLWALNDILITNLLGNPGFVVDYTIYYKLYSSITGLSMIIQGPIWVSVSMAYAKKDKIAIVNNLKFVAAFEALLFLVTILITIALPFVFNLWLGEAAPSIKTTDVIIMLMYSLVTTGYGAIVLICNGLAEVKSQLYIAAGAVILKIPLVLLLNFLFKNQLTWSVVILANTLLLIPYLIVCPIRIKKILNQLEAKKYEI